MIEALIRNKLLTDPIITGFVSTRIFAVVVPQGVAYPCIAFQLISRVGRDAFHNGKSPWLQSRFQFSCLSQDLKQSRQISSAISDIFLPFQGTENGTDVALVTYELEQEQNDPEIEMYATMLDLIFLHTQ